MPPRPLYHELLAPHYDDFTAAYAHDAWVNAIERRATELGLTGRRALDLACGTGKSTLPLLARGYSVLACDISEGMVREARRKLPEYSDAFLVADMRDLPAVGEFDLVLCLDDAVNYLVSDEELEATFAGVAPRARPRRGVRIRPQLAGDVSGVVCAVDRPRARGPVLRLEGRRHGEPSPRRAGLGHARDLRRARRWPLGAPLEPSRATPSSAPDGARGARAIGTRVPADRRPAAGSSTRADLRRAAPHQAHILRRARYGASRKRGRGDIARPDSTACEYAVAMEVRSPTG